jgi:hypothetical protein
MARFYFDVQQGEKITEDTEGEELPDVAAAEREAALAALHLSKDLMIAPGGSLVVEVRNEQRHPVLRAKVSLDVERR